MQSLRAKKLATYLVSALQKKHATIVCAESCTGGLVAGAITDVAGASAVLKCSFITYCDEAKQELLGVSPQTLEAHTAVSAETAAEMAQGARKRTAADLAISVTGVAGPGGGTPERPVGLVYIGVADKHGVQSYALHLRGSRQQIRQQVVAEALWLAYQWAR